jgi:hypothetical protein
LEGAEGRLFGHQIAFTKFLLLGGDVSALSIGFANFTFFVSLCLVK